MTETLQKQVVIQTTSRSNVSSNNDENLLNNIQHLSIVVIIISVISFLCGIANSLIWFSVWHAVWCTPLPFVAGILGIMIKSNSKSSIYNGVFIGFAMAGTILSITLIALESWFITVPRFRRLINASYGLGIFIIICACLLTILLITLTVLGFMRCSCYSKKKTKKVVYVQSSNVQSGNLVVPQNQQFYIKSKVPNDQPVFVQVVPNSNFVVPSNNVLVPNSNVVALNSNVVVPNDNDVVTNDSVAAKSDNAVATSESVKISSSSVTVIKTTAKTSTSKVNEAYEAEKTSAKTEDSSTSTFVSQVIDAIID